MDGGSARYYFVPRGGMHPLFGLSPEHGALYQVPPPPHTPLTFGGEGGGGPPRWLLPLTACVIIWFLA